MVTSNIEAAVAFQMNNLMYLEIKTNCFISYCYFKFSYFAYFLINSS